MNGRNGPLSPVSVGDTDSQWSGIGKYQSFDTDSQYSTGPNNRGQLATPPVSNGSNIATMNGGFPPRGSSGPNQGDPSPPASIARSSTGLYAQSDSGRSRKDEQFESTLSEHYIALKRYLAASLRDEKGNPRPNRARDKLLRLSPVQFQELSTDVFDELLRRQENSRRPPPAGSPESDFLLPKDTFHPKRNQARQKLSTLPPPRFRDLATDVFYELERRFPRFAAGEISRMGSPAGSMRAPSRNGTPVNGYGGPRIRRPSEATSVSAFSLRSESRNGNRPPPNPPNGIPPSPGLPPNDFGRPTPKTFQSNTLVPNKSTMVEDDETGGEDDDDDADAFNLESAARRPESKKSTTSDTDKKLIDDYQVQVAELREKLDVMEDNLKQKDDELNNILDGERSRATAANVEKKEFSDLRRDLENKLADAQNLNESLQSELDRLRSTQASTERDLRGQLEAAKASGGQRGGGNPKLEQENEDLRSQLSAQQRVTDEVRREAQGLLREMRQLSERTDSSYDREEQLADNVRKLEEEVKEWRNRYAKTKTQLRSLRASSIGLQIQQEATKYIKDSGFTQENGLVKDIHVTKFQFSVDELLQVARTDDPARVIDFMKAVVVTVRTIVQDIDEAGTAGGEANQQQTKLKSRVSATTNNLITASKNFASAKGLSPVSLLDAAASHLTSAIVELVRMVKIRPTPAGELEDEDDGDLTPLEAPGFFQGRNLRADSNPPPFRGFQNGRLSTESSMYSNSPRVSTDMRPRDSEKSWAAGQSSLPNGMNGVNGNKALPPPPMGVGFGIRTQDSDVEDLKIYLEDQTALLVQNIQSLVSSIRSEQGISAINTQINAIANVVGTVVTATETAMSSTGNGALRTQGDPIIRKLSNCRMRLLEAGERGREIADEGREDDEGERIWRQWNQTLPPIAFEIARETKELVLQVESIDEKRGGGGDDGDDFS